MTNDRKNFLSNSKKGSLITTGSYTYDGKKYECKDNKCLLMIDIGRGLHKYGIAYYWALGQGFTKDGRKLMLNFGDGFGTDH